MGEINDFMCEYLGLPRYNADFWNGTVFGGKRRVKIWQLERRDREYYKTQNGKKKAGSVRKDVQMLCKGKKDIILAVEIMATLDYSIPVRVMDYDAQELRRQIKDIGQRRRDAVKGKPEKQKGQYINDLRKRDRIVPIRTVVLYCGEGVYDGATGILELMDKKGMEQDFKRLLQDYNVRIFNMKDLKEENYETSFREIVGVFKRMNDREALLSYYIENEARFRQLDEISINVMGALIGMKNLRFLGQEKGGLNMCKAFADAIEEGRQKGLEQGREEGLEQGREEGLERGREEGLEQGREEGLEQGLEQGLKQGRQEGRKEGSFYALCCLVKKGKLQLQDAASEVGMTEELFLESMQVAFGAKESMI